MAVQSACLRHGELDTERRAINGPADPLDRRTLSMPVAHRLNGRRPGEKQLDRSAGRLGWHVRRRGRQSTEHQHQLGAAAEAPPRRHDQRRPGLVLDDRRKPGSVRCKAIGAVEDEQHIAMRDRPGQFVRRHIAAAELMPEGATDGIGRISEIGDVVQGDKPDALGE